MARVAFFCESLPGDTDLRAKLAYKIIRDLQKNQHKVHVFSTFRSTDQLSPENNNEKFEISYPFKKWRPWEFLRALPEVIKFKPDIVHIIQSTLLKNNSLLNIQNWIPHLKPLFHDIPVVVSLYENQSVKDSHQTVSPIIEGANLILVPNVTFQNQVMSSLRSTQAIQVEIIPPYLDPEPKSTEPSWISETRGRKFIVYGTLADRKKRAKIILAQLASLCHSIPDLQIVFIDGWGAEKIQERKNWQKIIQGFGCAHRIIFCEKMTAPQKQLIRSQADGAIAVGLNPTTVEFTSQINQSLQEKLPLVISTHQAHLTPLPPQAQPLITEITSIDQISQTMIQSGLPSKNYRKNRVLNLPTHFTLEIDDAASNWISRLYQTLLS